MFGLMISVMTMRSNGQSVRRVYPKRKASRSGFGWRSISENLTLARLPTFIKTESKASAGCGRQDSNTAPRYLHGPLSSVRGAQSTPTGAWQEPGWWTGCPSPRGELASWVSSFLEGKNSPKSKLIPFLDFTHFDFLKRKYTYSNDDHRFYIINHLKTTSDHFTSLQKELL